MTVNSTQWHIIQHDKMQRSTLDGNLDEARCSTRTAPSAQLGRTRLSCAQKVPHLHNYHKGIMAISPVFRWRHCRPVVAGPRTKGTEKGLAYGRAQCQLDIHQY